MLSKDLLSNSSDSISQRFLMLVQSVSGIRGLTTLDSHETSEEELLDKVLSVLIQNLDMDKCSIFLFNEDRELECVAAKCWDEQLNLSRLQVERYSHKFKPGEGIIGITAKTRKIYHCHDCRADSKFLPVIHPDVDKDIGSLICAPIMAGAELLGVLNISHPHKHFFHSWQEHATAIYANVLGQMLHNNRLMLNMKSEVEKRTFELKNALEETLKLKARFEELAVIDDLTQLHNRRYFFSEASSALSLVMRQQSSFSLLLLDLDNFKSINDSYGHEYGDIVLKDIGALLKKQTRTGDVVARLGGEEFAFALPNTDLDGAQLFAERIRDRVEQLSWSKNEKHFGVTMSIGITELNKRDNEPEKIINTLYTEADQALYSCKGQGRNRVIVFSEE